MREQVLKLEKVKKSCRTAKKVTKIITILLVSVTILCLVGTVICFLFRESINPEMAKQAENITFGDVNIGGILSFQIDTAGLIADGKYAEVSGIYCIISSIICAICAMVFGTLCKVFTYLENSVTPFSQNVLKKMKKTFILLVIMLALLVGIGVAVMIGLCLWCIYCILDYGITLQMEIDETV